MVGLPTTREWAVKIVKPSAIVGLTNYPRAWSGDPSGVTSVIEVRVEWFSGCWYFVLKRFLRDRSEGQVQSSELPLPLAGDWLAYDQIYCTGSRFEFSSDLATNTLTVGFRNHILKSVIPDLASYRPFCFFASDRNAQVAFETM